jgi:hypothetical protein
MQAPRAVPWRGNADTLGRTSSELKTRGNDGVTKAERRRKVFNWTYALELMIGSIIVKEMGRFSGLPNSKRVQGERLEGGANR